MVYMICFSFINQSAHAIYQNTNLAFSPETNDLKALSLTTSEKCLKAVASQPQGRGFVLMNLSYPVLQQ